MPELRYSVERSRFKRLRKVVGDPFAVFGEEVVERIEQHFEQTFATRGRAADAAWEPLSRVTLKIDKKLRRNPRPVEQTPGVGRIRRSLTSSTAPYALRRTTRDKVTVGTKVTIASQLQRGYRFSQHNSSKSVRVPGRTIAATTRALERDLERIVDRAVDADSY